jgi:hypothetical protein
VNFTREPIIETVITPREGMKLLVRNSKGGGEEYSVDAVEVVSFGTSLFFRSLERPKSFLVPVSDYEVVELKEVRVPLKTASLDRSIKIGGGREMKPPKDYGSDEREAQTDAPPMEQQPRPPQQEQRLSERKNKRRRGRRGGRLEPSHQESEQQPPSFSEQTETSQETRQPTSGAVEEQKAPSFISKLFPPPPTLIKETLSRYKPVEPPLPVVKEDELVLEEKFEMEETLDFPDTTKSPEEEN